VPHFLLFEFGTIIDFARTAMLGDGDVHGVLVGRVLPGIALTIFFALVAFGLRAVTGGGAIAGAVFVLTLAATLVGHSRKQQLGAAEHRSGRRGDQVLANLAVAAACSAGAVAWGRPWLLVCMAAALTEAAADTVASECGEAWSDRVYMVTTLEPVAVGTDGGISVAGSLSGIVVACIVAGICHAMGIVTRRGALIAAGAAITATILDSFLGATLQRRGWLSNSAVNFLSTLVAAVIAAAFAMS
jgi:uncharacterized protein (TIGR00297 family)